MQGNSYEEVDPEQPRIVPNYWQIAVDFLKVACCLYFLSCILWMMLIVSERASTRIIGLVMLIPLGILLLVGLIWAFVTVVNDLLIDHIKKNWYVTEGGIRSFEWTHALVDIVIWFFVADSVLSMMWVFMIFGNHALAVKIVGIVFLSPMVIILVVSFGVCIVHNIVRGVCKCFKHVKKHWWTEKVPRDTEIEMTTNI